MTRKTCFADIESTGIQNLFSQTPEEQFRLGQWAFGRDGDIHTTESYETFMNVMYDADLIVGHNYIAYDLTALFGKDDMTPLHWALEGKVLDTMVWYPLRNRIPMYYTRRDGSKATTYQQGKQKPELVQRFLSLDNLTFQHDLPGKMGNLKDMARQYNPVDTPDKQLDFGLIPTDDPEFLGYAKQDIVAVRALATFLLDQGNITEYEWREMVVASINAQITKNGFTVDRPVAEARVEELATKRAEVMGWLVEEYDFPTVGKSPWDSTKGKEAIVEAFASFGVTPETHDWPRTPKDALKLGGKDLIELAEGTEAEPFAEAIASLKGLRTLAQLALDSTWPDGKVHPQISSLQRSGRFSMTEPSLPIWTARGPGAVEKAYFVASPGCALVSMDFSNADQRIVAALSGDTNYAKRFEPGVDGHEVSGRLMFGDAGYLADAVKNRDIAKALSHAYAYGAGVKTLARTSKLPASDDPEQSPMALAQRFVDAMNSAYPDNVKWRKRAYEAGLSGWITSEWSRVMPVDVERAYTQSPGLLGQNGTREILMDGLIRVAREKPDVLRWLVATVHDEVVWDFPITELGWVVDWVMQKLHTVFEPWSGGQAIEFPLNASKPSPNWFMASH